MKASEGKGGRTTRHDAHVAGLRAAGRLVGHYHFAWPVNGGQADAANFLAAAKAQPGDVLALDWEPYGPSGVGVTPAMAFPYIRDFATAVRAAAGAWPWLYTNDDQLTKIRAAVSAVGLGVAHHDAPVWKAGVGNLYVSDPGKGPGYGLQLRPRGRVPVVVHTDRPGRVLRRRRLPWRSLGVPQEGDMALTPAEIQAVADAVWEKVIPVGNSGDRARGLLAQANQQDWSQSATLGRLEALLNRPAPAPVPLSDADVQRIADAVRGRIVKDRPVPVYFGGAFTDATTVDLLRELQRVTGLSILLTQGSYSTTVSASGGTHDGGGVVDINVSGWNYTTIWNVLKAGRSMGGVAWYRTPSQGFAYHIHMLRADCTDLSPAARAQNVQYLNGQNGLANHGTDDGPLGYVGMTWAKYNGTTAYRPPLNIPDPTNPTEEDDMFTTDDANRLKEH